jgi:hypothetical protein
LEGQENCNRRDGCQALFIIIPWTIQPQKTGKGLLPAGKAAAGLSADCREVCGFAAFATDFSVGKG